MFAIANDLLIFIAISCLANATLAAAAVVPSLDWTPRLRFHLGQIENNQPLIYPIAPDMPYAESKWYIAQWNQSLYIHPESMKSDDPKTADALLGNARYSFNSPDNHSHVWIFGHSRSWVYELFETGGTLTAAGGSNIFLSSNLEQDIRFDKPVNYSLDAKISKAHVTYNDSAAKRTGAVLGQVFSGFGLMFHDPANGQQQFVFMQIILSASQPVTRQAGRICTLNGGKPNLLFGPSLVNNEPVLPFQADNGPLHHVHYRMNGYISEMTSRAYDCGNDTISWSAAAHDMKNWQLSGLYIGIETESKDARLPDAATTKRGEIEVGVQLAHVSIY